HNCLYAERFGRRHLRAASIRQRHRHQHSKAIYGCSQQLEEQWSSCRVCRSCSPRGDVRINCWSVTGSNVIHNLNGNDRLVIRWDCKQLFLFFFFFSFFFTTMGESDERLLKRNRGGEGGLEFVCHPVQNFMFTRDMCFYVLVDDTPFFFLI